MKEKVKSVPAERRATTPGASRGFQAIRDEIDRMFHALSLPEMDWKSGPLASSETLSLRVDVAETDGEIIVTAELPGIEEADVDVALENDILRIRAEKRSEEETKEKTWHVVERAYGSFERSIRMPAGIDPDAVSAKFGNGVLTVKLPKPPKEAAARKKIPISAG